MKYICLILLIYLPVSLFSQKMVSQPFIGHTSSTEINGWAMFKKADSVSIHIWSGDDLPGQTKNFYLNKEKVFKHYLPVSFSFDGLKPGKSYFISYLLHNDETMMLPFVKTKIDTLSDFSFLAGSCAFIGTGFNGLLKPVNNLDIFTYMKNDSADFMIWLGDNLYYIFEARNYKTLLKRNVKTRLNKELAAFLNSKQQYAIWDDHDYGTNNSDGSFKHKNASLDVFNQFWPNPKRDSFASNYFTFSHQDAQFFMLDDRYDGEKATVILGSTQLKWLKKNLLNSTATFKFICVGMQALNPLSTMECFSKTEAECNELIGFIKEHKINGVIFLSGDRHHGELIKVDQKDAYQLYDFTASPITMYPVNISKGSPEYNNPYRVPGTLFPDYNYAKIRISGAPASRLCTLELYNKEGQLVWSHSISARTLRF